MNRQQLPFVKKFWRLRAKESKMQFCKQFAYADLCNFTRNNLNLCIDVFNIKRINFSGPESQAVCCERLHRVMTRASPSKVFRKSERVKVFIIFCN